jgi:membrane protein
MPFRTKLKRRIYTSYPGRTFIEGAKALYLPGFKGFSLFEVWPPFIRQLRKTSLVERAAAISFNIFMAIPPTLIFVFTLVPYLPISGRFIEELFALIRDVVPGEKNNSVIIGFLSDFLTQPRNELLSFGLLLALFFSSNAMMGVLRSFNKNYLGFRKRTGLRKRQTALLLTITVFALVFISLLLLIAHGAVLKWLGLESETWRSIIHNARWLIILFLFFFTVSFIYRHGAATERRWPFLTPGSVFATALMILATTLVSFWVNNFGSYNKVYGSISAIFILMLLIFANSLAVLLGFELNVTLMNLMRRSGQAVEISQIEDKRQDAATNG